jgi:hypothetical protein
VKQLTPVEDWENGPYMLLVASSTVEKEWTSFVGRSADRAKETFERLTTYPRDHIPGRQFPLKGKALKPFWEYEASAADRLWYAVSEQPQEVIVVGVRSDIHSGQKVRELIAVRRAAVVGNLRSN